MKVCLPEHRLWLVGLLACLVSCDGPTEILVRVRSELPEASIRSVMLHVTFPDGSTDEESVDKLPFLAVIGPQGGSGEVLVTATARGPIGELTSEAYVHFVSGESRLLDLEFRQRCLDAPVCSADESCEGCEGCQAIERARLPSVAQGSVDADEPLVDCFEVVPDDAAAEMNSSMAMDGSTAPQARPDDRTLPDAGDAKPETGPTEGGSDDDAGDAPPDTGTSPADAAVPAAPDCESRACVRSISLGDRHACFVLENRRMYCWGNAAEGQLGLGPQTTATRGIVRVPNYSNWEDVTAEGANTCGTNDEGGVFCWGQFWGIVNFEVPQQAQGLADAEALESGNGWACVVTGGSAVDCFGYYTGIPAGGVVRVGMPSTGATWRSLPDSLDMAYLIDDKDRLWSWLNLELTLEESGVKDAALVGAKCVLFQDGRLRCEGTNDQGQVGNGSVSGSSAAPHEVVVEGVSWQAVGSSTSATCAVSQRGDVWCWGSNRAGAMGVSPSEQPRVTSPRLVATAPKDDPYVAVEVGVGGVCGLRASSWVDCWGGEAPEAFGMMPTALRVP